MKYSRILFATSLLLFSGYVVVMGEDSPASGADDLLGKVVVVELETQGTSYTLANSSVKTIGGRAFLVAKHPNKSGRKPNTGPTMALAWDKIGMLTIYESLEAYRNRVVLPVLADVPTRCEINRIRHQIENLIPDIVRHKRFVATTEVEIERRKSAAAKTEDKDARIAVDNVRHHREEELLEIEKALVDLATKQQRLEVVAKNMRHEELVKGRLP